MALLAITSIIGVRIHLSSPPPPFDTAISNISLLAPFSLGFFWLVRPANVLIGGISLYQPVGSICVPVTRRPPKTSENLGLFAANLPYIICNVPNGLTNALWVSCDNSELPTTCSCFSEIMVSRTLTHSVGEKAECGSHLPIYIPIQGNQFPLNTAFSQTEAAACRINIHLESPRRGDMHQAACWPCVSQFFLYHSVHSI